MTKQNQSDRCEGDRSSKNLNTQTNSTPDLSPLLQAFERLSANPDPVSFHVQFEWEQRQSGLRLSTFKAAWSSWNQQQEGGTNGQT